MPARCSTSSAVSGGSSAAGPRATCESLASTGHARQFDVFVLSDSNDATTIAAEREAWEQLRAALVSQPGQPADLTVQPAQPDAVTVEGGRDVAAGAAARGPILG